VSRSALAPALALLLLTAGCLSAGAPSHFSTAEACPPTVGFYAHETWGSDEVRIGYELPANAAVVFVVYENETVIGTAHADGGAGRVGVDGDPIELDRSLDGRHSIRVVAYGDENGNGEFDAGTDQRCRRDGEVIATDSREFNFSSRRAP
jgi:hypothetical protein